MEFLLHQLHQPQSGFATVKMMKATVYSVFMDNINSSVVRNQRECVKRFLPSGWTFKQFCHKMTHPEAMAACVDENKEELSVFLDIDCIPLAPISFTYLMDARWSASAGALIGAAQRANHIKNNAHMYVGPFCMAFKNSVYRELGSPSFAETWRGDVGEELTYTWQEKNKPVFFIYPSDVEKPMWDLIDNVSQFGLGTTYENLFYHSFCIRGGGSHETQFLKKCKSVLKNYDAAVKEKEGVAQ